MSGAILRFHMVVWAVFLILIGYAVYDCGGLGPQPRETRDTVWVPTAFTIPPATIQADNLPAQLELKRTKRELSKVREENEKLRAYSDSVEAQSERGDSVEVRVARLDTTLVDQGALKIEYWYPPFNEFRNIFFKSAPHDTLLGVPVVTIVRTETEIDWVFTLATDLVVAILAVLFVR